MKAHELIAALHPDSQDYADCVVATKFDLGEIEDAHNMATLGRGDFFELPSEICLFQIVKEPDIYMLLARDLGDFVRWVVFTKIAQSGGHWQGITQEVDISKSGGVTVRSTDTGEVVDLDFGHDHFGLLPHRAWALAQTLRVSQAVEVFSCCNVQLAEHQPPRFINQKRINKGRVPFYAYKTLRITLDEDEKGGGQRGTGAHSSPRLHLRRGHIRRLSDGRRVWVRAHLVGDKSHGMIHKDYDVRQAGT